MTGLADVRSRGSLTRAERKLLEHPEAKRIIARLDAATDLEFEDRVDHVLRAACVAISSRQRPQNRFAVPTL